MGKQNSSVGKVKQQVKIHVEATEERYRLTVEENNGSKLKILNVVFALLHRAQVELTEYLGLRNIEDVSDASKH